MALVEASGGADPGGRRDEELVRLHVLYAMTRDKRLRRELRRGYGHLAARLAAEFPDRPGAGEEAEAALVRALDRYTERDGPFRLYATARIRAALRRLGPAGAASPRSAGEDEEQVSRTVADLTQELGRSPRVNEIAARSGMSEEQVLMAMEHVPLDHHD